MEEQLSSEIEARVAALGYELVELEQAGSKTRPILRLRIERAGAAEQGDTPQQAVTVEDCTRVSRDVEAFLDEREDLSDRYVLEVSSPGLERPLTKRRDYERFTGKEIALKTSESVGDLGKRIEGVLRGINDADIITLGVNDAPVEIALSNVKRAHLIFRWKDKK